ncbi:Ribonuclease H-like superfamily [Sesbania bispinosa]|nr:Ribonuclease H-like superfamily [Sesbania bispinosa]
MDKGLKTRSKGFNRGFMDSNLCPLCGYQEETTIHILRDCIKVKDVWINLAHGALPAHFSELHLLEWIHYNLSKQGELFNPDIVVYKTLACASAGNFLGDSCTHQGRRVREEQIKWSFPDPGWIKVNVDGSIRQGLNGAGCGGIFRGVNGKWMLGFSFNMGRGNILLAELRAVETTLKIYWDKGYSNICLESDSLTAIS